MNLVALITSVTLLMVGPALSEDSSVTEPFVLDSTTSAYPFAMKLVGTITRKGNTLEILVETGEVRSAIPAQYDRESKATSVVIAFGLGRQIADGWEMIHESAEEPVAAGLMPTEALPLAPQRFSIKGLGEVALAETWIVARLTVDQKLPGIKAGRLSSYACSEVNLLGETSQSRARKALMAENYAHFC